MNYSRPGLTSSFATIVLFIASVAGFAQSSECPAVELGMNIVLPNGRTVKGLKSQNLNGSTKHEAVAIDSLTLDTAPRRVLLVLDMGHDLAPDARRAQLEIASYLVSEGRDTDTFGLLTARGAIQKVGFDKGRAAVSSAIAELQNKRGGPSTDTGILDAVLEGISWFQKPAPGDAIIVMASEIETNRSARYAQVADALGKNRIRLFSIALAPILAGTLFSPMDPFRSHNQSWGYSLNEENLSALTWNSGGYMLFEETQNPWKEYKLTDEHLQKLLDEAGQMYAAIAAFYRVTVRVPSGVKHREGWKLDLADDIRKKIPTAYVVYPRLLEPCTAEPAAHGQ